MREVPSYNFFDKKEFEREFINRMKILEKAEDIPFLPVGNIFVDYGILSIGVYQEIDNVEDVTLKDALNAFTHTNGVNSYGNDFLARNARSKSYTMVFGINNPLTQGAFGTDKEGSANTSSHLKPSNIIPSPLQYRISRAYILEFLVQHFIDKTTELESNNYCISCGSQTDMNFNNMELKLGNLISNKTRKFGGGTTRSWFPLIGSVSAAQSFPSFSEPNTVCGKCLFAVQFLPQICNIFDGNLSCFQSNNFEFTKKFIEKNIDQYIDLLQVDVTKKIENIGKKESYRYVTLNLLDILDSSLKIGNSNLIIFLFSNSGTGPFAKLIILPNHVLEFLREVSMELNIRNELEKYINIEKKVLKFSDRFFINCLISNSDYMLFYPKISAKEYILPSLKLYHFYQLNIRAWSNKAIELVKDSCKNIKLNEDNEKIIRILKSGKKYELLTLVQPHILNILKQDNERIEGILDLFATTYDNIPNRNPLDLFKFYLHPEIKFTNYKVSNYEFDHSENKFNLSILDKLSKFAINILKIERKRSSFNFDKYMKSLHRISKHDLFIKFIKIGMTELGYTFSYFNSMFIGLTFNEFRFFFRVYSILGEDIDDIDEISISHKELIKQSGMNASLCNAIINYIDVRISQIGSKRVFFEISTDLRNGDYTASNFHQLLNDKIEITNELLAKEGNEELPYLSDFQFYLNNKNNDFSWYELRNKIRLFILQYKLLRNQRTKPLIEQIKEEK